MSLRRLPSVDQLVRRLDTDGLPRGLVVETVRAAVESARTALGAGEQADPADLAGRALERLRRTRPTEVINATGVLLHTNLGRAPLSAAAAAAAEQAACSYGNLELDLETGERGGRSAYVARLACHLTGAEAAMVVNNNAGALFLTLAALAQGRSVPVSRGELIEIGGSYRLPVLMAASGARLVEVGTTNRTRTADYAAALDGTTALILKVHPSNYRLSGFTEEADLADLAGLARRHGLPLAFDAGSGLLDAAAPWLGRPPPAWLRGEPGIRQSLEQGADLVMFSGDKLLGGPQAGVVVGSRELIGKLTAHPVARALRLDPPNLAALAVTLEAYADDRAVELPLWRMATTSYVELEQRAKQVATEAGIDATIEAGVSTIGAGSVPGSEVDSPVISLGGRPADRLYLVLLGGNPPVLGRRHEGRLVLDLRAVPPPDDHRLARALAAACRS